MTRKFMIISVILIFIVSPFIAWGAVAIQYTNDPHNKIPDTNVTAATREELLKVVTTKSKENHLGREDDIKVLDIVSYENINTWWYIIKVKSASFGKENLATSPMILVKYYNGPDSIRIVTNPGEPLPFYNISDSSGIPYEVIEKYNKILDESQAEPEEEELL